jgi:integrase
MRRRMQQHVCRGLSASSVRQVLWILSGAFDKAVRWKWIALNPAHQADKPALPHPDPRPPSAADASRIVTEAWRDPDRGTFVWCAMTLGARRGELCALRWRNVDLANNVVTLRHAIAVGPDRQLVERSTRTHQQRRVVLDDETVQVLADHRRLWQERVDALGVELSPTRSCSRPPRTEVPPVAGHHDADVRPARQAPRHRQPPARPAALLRDRAHRRG